MICTKTSITLSRGDVQIGYNHFEMAMFEVTEKRIIIGLKTVVRQL